MTISIRVSLKHHPPVFKIATYELSAKCMLLLLLSSLQGVLEIQQQ
jgi:hypothetical protein